MCNHEPVGAPKRVYRTLVTRVHQHRPRTAGRHAKGFDPLSPVLAVLQITMSPRGTWRPGETEVVQCLREGERVCTHLRSICTEMRANRWSGGSSCNEWQKQHRTTKLQRRHFCQEITSKMASGSRRFKGRGMRCLGTLQGASWGVVRCGQDFTPAWLSFSPLG